MKKYILSLLMMLMTVLSHAQQAIGLFESNADIGNPALKGNTQYDAATQQYTLTGAGINMWGTTDQFHFLFKKIKGDFMISATVQFLGKGTEPHRKIGIIARNSLDNNAAYADACVHGDGLTSLQYRLEKDSATVQTVMPSNGAIHIELQRSGNIFTFSSATAGENYKVASQLVMLNAEVFAGLFICSHNPAVIEQAVFSNVRIVIPADAGFKPYSDYIGSHLEVMDVQSGLRKILYSVPNSIQAPNWTPDGKKLIYNSEGLLYNFDLATGKPAILNTGFANQNNNDHVLSFDGKQIAISNHVGAKRISTLFVLPVTGSDNPVQVTSPDSGHSYLHSWSPDGKRLVFAGQRNNQYDIWAVDIKTKKEYQLTNTPTLDDSPEFSPDGKWIYFNSVRTGTMKLWRMKPDGSKQEQVTFDEYNDWFPHFSPDGKWIVFLSYPKEINPADHPWYQKVYIRLMSAGGGVPKNIAYLYGGQGTINVPSWSPDSKKIAFVSNTKL